MSTTARWHTGVCKRRLRPLASKITAYQKRLREYRMRQAATRRSHLEPRYCNDETNPASILLVSYDSPNILPAWSPLQHNQKMRRKIKIKYRAGRQELLSRSRSKDQPINAQDISLTTPYLQRNPPRSGSHFPSSPALVENINISDLGRQSPNLTPKHVQSCFLELMHSTCGSKSSENTRTKPLGKPAAPLRGARSLLKMCLRHVPAHILDEQRYRLSMNPDDKTDVCDETYEDLGQFDLDTGLQNQIMRRVARAHAIQMYMTLINDAAVSATALWGLLTPQVLETLAPDEIDDMLYSWMRVSISTDTTATTHKYFQRRLLPEPFKILGNLQYLLRDKHPTLTYRVFTKLIASGSLGAEQMGHSGLRKVWRGALKSIAMQTIESHAAMLFIETALSVAAGVCPDSATQNQSQSCAEQPTSFLQSHLDWANIDFEDDHEQCYTALIKTVSSICTLLSATTMINRSNSARILNPESCRLEYSLRPLRSAAAAISKAYQSPQFANKAKKTGFPLMAAIIILADLQVTRKDYQLEPHSEHEAQELRVWTLQKLRKLAGSFVFAMSEVDEKLAELLHATSKCLRRATPPLQEEAMYIPLEPTSPGDNARDYTSMVQRLFELDGRAVQNNKCGSSHIQIAEAREQALRERTGFRWEDGLEEWVTITPANASPVQSIVEHSSPARNYVKIAATTHLGDSPLGLLKRSTEYSSDHDMDSDYFAKVSSQTSFQSSPPTNVGPHDNEDTEDELAALESPSNFRSLLPKRTSPTETLLRRTRQRRHM